MISTRWSLLVLGLLVAACSSDDSGDPAGTAGTSAGSSGAAGASAGTSGTGGTAGKSGGPGGTAGTSGGSGGTAGTTGGSAGTSSGSSGTAGTSSGSSGTAGASSGSSGAGGQAGGSAGAGGEAGGSAGSSDAGAGGSTGTPPHKLTVTWSLKKADGTAEACPANYGTIKVSAQVMSSLTAPSSPIGSPFEALFDCKAGTGTIELPTSGDQATPPCYGSGCGSSVNGNTGKYFVTLYLTDSSGETVRYTAPLVGHTGAVRPKLDADMTTGDRSLDFTFYPSAGFILFNWGLQAKSNFASVSCAASGVDTVKVHTQLVFDADGNPVTNGPEYVDTFPCAGDPTIESTAPFTIAAGLSRALAPSDYRILSLEAFTGGKKVGQSDPTTTSDVHLEAGKNVDTSLPEADQIVIDKL